MRPYLFIALFLPLSGCSTIESGNCFYSLKPVTFKTIQEPVVIGNPTGAQLTIVSAIYGTEIITYILKEATTETVKIPAVYKYIDGKRVVVEKERFEERYVPPVTKDVEERVVITPAYKPGPEPPQPRIKFETRRVIDTPAMTVVADAKGKVHKELESDEDFELFQKDYNCSAR